MEAQVFHFPTKAAPAWRRPAPRCRASEIDVAGIASLMKMTHFQVRTIIAKIRLLIDGEGFPEPRTPRFVKGARQTGGDAVWAKSRWERDEVERWFDDDLPPAAAQASAAGAQTATRDRLAKRARLVAGVA